MNNNIDNEESIDLGRLARVMVEHKSTTGGIVVGCTALALAAAFILPPKYESSTVVQIAGLEAASSKASALAALGGGGSTPTQSYMELMKTRTVLEPIIDDLPIGQDPEKRPSSKDFAKNFLKIENTKQTDLITITAKAPTPEEAQYIAQSVADNFLVLQTNKNTETQSFLLQFLNERIETARQAAEDASQKFADYQKTHKIYSPTDQAKSIVSQTEAWDKAIGDMEVQRQAAQAQLDAVRAQIGDQENRSDAFQINDNGNVQALRGQIVSKQVELVGLRQKYTDNHPAVKAAEDELQQLRSSLSNEVDAVVRSHTSTMNPTHAGLVKQQVEGEVALATSQASEAAIKARRDQKEKELGDFPQDVMDYMNLQREAGIKQTIYTNLVEQSEAARIQEAKKSMDIQIIDPADLPREDRPASPKKLLFTAVGFVLGCLISFAYGLVCYKREGC